MFRNLITLLGLIWFVATASAEPIEFDLTPNEAVKRLARRSDVERRRLLVMERTIRLELRARPLHRDVRTDQVHDVGRFQDFFDTFL